LQERCPACDAATTIAISTDLSASNKVYDATAAATLTGILLTDAVSVSGTANTGTFDAGKNVGTGKSVAATLSGQSLGSTDAGNYRISTVTTPLTADITKPNLTTSNCSGARAN
jgi:hypothetical protein